MDGNHETADLLAAKTAFYEPQRDASGRLFWVAAVARDITERKKVEEALAQKTRELEAVLSALPDLYFRLDAEGTYLDCRAGRMADLYLPAEEMLGKRIRDVLPPELAHRIELALAEVLTTQRLVTLEYDLVWAERTQTFEARLLPLVEDQVVEGERRAVNPLAGPLLPGQALAEDRARKEGDEVPQLRGLIRRPVTKETDAGFEAGAGR